MIKYRFLLALLLAFCCELFSSCSKDEDEIVTETSINYTLTISPDLLKFVTPQVKYVDENGVLVTITGVEELDGLAIENKAEIDGNGIHASGWTQQTITGTGYKCWTINMKFRHLDFHSRMCVNYIPKELVEDIEGKSYDFHHSVNTSVMAITSIKSESLSSITQNTKVYSDSHISITKNNYKQGDDLKVYLEILSKSPDKVGYYINGDGDVSPKDDFDLN